MTGETKATLDVIFSGILAAGVLGGGAVVAVKLISFFTGMSANLNLVLTNHLPHIQAELEGIKQELRSYLSGHYSSSDAERSRVDQIEVRPSSR